ncbi:MAG: hypothetical protein H8D97_01085 [Proteobacteria bacterium]|nr:hypothetical protein [Pseudomonadota bacterium]
MDSDSATDRSILSGSAKGLGAVAGTIALGRTLGGTRASIHAKRAGKKIKQGYHISRKLLTRDQGKKEAHQKKADIAGGQSRKYGALLRRSGIGGTGRFIVKDAKKARAKGSGNKKNLKVTK